MKLLMDDGEKVLTRNRVMGDGKGKVQELGF